MLKYKCSSCGQQVLAMASPDPARMKCPRCGGVTDTTPKVGGDASAPPQGAMVGDMLEDEHQAAQRRAAEDAAAESQRDSEALASYEQRHEQAARFDKLGGSAPSQQPKSWVVSLFVYAAVLTVIAAVFVAVSRSPGDEEQDADGAFALVDNGAAAQAVADAWARRLFPHQVSHVYAIQYNAVSEPREGLVMIKGVALGGDVALTDAQIASLMPHATSESSREKLRSDMQIIKDAYDPDKFTGATTGAKKQKPDAEAELRGLGYDDPQAAMPDVDVLREAFICVVNCAEDGAALDYFVWKAKDGSLIGKQLKGDQAAEVKAAAEQVFAGIRDGTGFHQLLLADAASDAERMFPTQYKPKSWRTLRSDRMEGGVVRVFIRVTDDNAHRSGTWLVDMRDSAGKGWRVVGTFTPQ